MKTILTIVVALACSLAMAQRNTSISRSINDDGKTLSIRINGTVNGNLIDYDRTFDVASLNKEERNALREHILDSLNVGMPEPPKPPAPPRAPRAPMALNAPVPPNAPMAPTPPAIMSSDQSTVSVSNGDNQVVAVGGKNPYTKEVKYNSESGQLFLRYRFTKDGEEITYERKVDARDKSKQERQRIIDSIEQEIGVPKVGK